MAYNLLFVIIGKYHRRRSVAALGYWLANAETDAGAALRGQGGGNGDPAVSG